MAETAGRGGAGMDTIVRMLFWSGAAMLLIAPLAAMQLSGEFGWSAGDFIFAAVLIGAVGALFELTMRRTRSWAYRFGVGFAAAAAFVIVVATGAVGMIGDEGDIYNLYFFGAIGVAVAGAAAARLRPSGMALAMLAAGAVQASLGIGGLPADPLGGFYSIALAGLWLVSATLFRKAAREP